MECAIDVRVYATWLKCGGGKWNEKNLVYLAGVYEPKQKIEESEVPVAGIGYLESHPEIKRVVVHFDRDKAGREATEVLRLKLSDKYEVVDSPPDYGKDYNDFLCLKLGIYKSKERSFER